MRITRGRVPVRTQLTQTECGCAVASALISHYGRFEDIYSARSYLKAGRDGVSLRQIAQGLESNGMEVKLLTIGSISELSLFSCPVIVLWEEAHFVIVESYNGRTARIMDPAVGHRTVHFDELEQKASRSVLWAVPGPSFEKRPRPFLQQWRNLPINGLWMGIRVAQVTALAALQFLAVLLIPLAIQWLIDSPDWWSGNLGTAYVVAVTFAVVFFALILFTTRVTARFASDLGELLTTNVLTRLLRLPYDFFSSRETGELIYRIGTVDVVRDTLAGGLANTITGAGVILGVSIYLLTLPANLAAVILPILLLNLTVTWVGVKRLALLVDEELAKGGRESTLRLDALTSLASIRIGGYEGGLLDRWHKDFEETLQVMRKRMMVDDGFVSGFSTAVSLISPVLVTLLLTRGVLSGQITAGELVAALALSGSLFQTVPSFSRACASLGQASRYLSRLDDITETPPEDPGGSRIGFDRATLVFRDLSYRFDDNSAEVLSGINFVVHDGTTVAIVGDSGSGKSTLGALTATLLTPTSGELTIGGYPTTDFTLSELRKSIGYVPQENKLLNGTILENLSLGLPIDATEALQMCYNVGLDSMIAELPMGLQTVVSDMGSNFSGGQRQRLALARTLLQKPRIVIMDEATASLDLQSERQIVEYLRSLDVTQVVIAHRLDSIRHADHVVVLDQGRVVEQGTYDELRGIGSYFHQLESLEPAYSSD